MTFVNRETELAALEAIDRRKVGQLVAVFGRRRIGKTALLTRWLERPGTRGAYWVAHRSTSAVLLGSFSRALGPLIGTGDAAVTFGTWQEALEQVARLAERRPLTLVLDELPYLLDSVPPFATMLQAVWDHALKRSRVRLIVAGSHFHMMHQAFTSAKGPLFGRATATLHIDELGPRDMALFLPSYSAEQIVETFSVIGGVPKYLEMWNERRPVLANVREILLAPETLFRNEPAFLIQDEIAEPRTYVAILEALGSGARRPVEIARSAGIPLAHVGKYLSTLCDLRFVRRVLSVDTRSRTATRNTLYEIRDPYLRFHFTFVQPHLDLVEQKRGARIVEIVRRGFFAHVGRTGYEEVCRKHVAELADRGELPFDALEVGRLFDRRVEIDVAAIDERQQAVLVGECRWRRAKMAEDVLDALTDKASSLARIRGAKVHYALFSRSGFTKALERRAAREGVLLFEGVPGLSEPRGPGADSWRGA